MASTQTQTKTIQNLFDGDVPSGFTDCLDFISKKGKELFGQHFKIEIDDYEVIYKLVIYFLKRQDLADKYFINLNKGILLTGPIGCGKTTLMTIMNYFPQAENRYFMKTCRDISFEFHKEGYEVVQEYSKKANHQRQGEYIPKAFCFDDLGVENNLKHFGNECNIMGEILLSRYEMYVTRKAITHITTNLSSSEIELVYGNRVRSRMREMLNLMSFNKDCVDKRK
jgi:energy-coupling factor transporter ATP-binding protein EcfA2